MYDDPLDEIEEWDTMPGAPNMGLPLDQLLDQFVSDAQLPEIGAMAALSDLTRDAAEAVRRQWPLIPEMRRLTIVRQLIAAAEESLDWHLGRFLRITLDDEQDDVRALAIQGLSEDVEPDLASAFVQLLRDDPAGLVRAAAASALGSYVLAGELDELDSALAMRAEETLLSVLHNDIEPLLIRCRALESIAFSGEVGVRQLIDDGYYSPYEEMRLSALVAMGRSADVRWRGQVRAELQNPSPAMRAQAARACGELEIKAAVADLLELLGDEEQIVRVAAITALGRIGGMEATDALYVMQESDDAEEAEAAELALEEMLFYAGSDVDAAPLFDEQSEDDGEWDGDIWDDADDRDFGVYE